MSEEQTPAPVEAVREVGSHDGALPWMSYAINAVIALIMVLGSLLVYHQWVVAPNRQRFAMVDIAEVLELKQLQLTAMAAKAAASDQDRGAAFEQLASFGKALENEVGRLQQTCGCTLLVRAAVVKTTSEDLTPALKERLGLAGLNVTELTKQLRSAPLPGPLPGESTK